MRAWVRAISSREIMRGIRRNHGDTKKHEDTQSFLYTRFLRAFVNLGVFVPPSPSRQEALQLLGMAGACEGVLAIDQPAADEIRQRLLDRERSLPARDRDLLVQ